MRAIKFRAKRIKYNDWRYGSPIKDGEKTILASNEEWNFVDANTVGQFIGLHDVDCHAIFEGDIIKTMPHGDVLQVVYNTADAQFIGVGDNGKLSFANKYIRYKVIGNIHDNPELIK
jgi:uncharacterized phage protein (TIGR01671 family)